MPNNTTIDTTTALKRIMQGLGGGPTVNGGNIGSGNLVNIAAGLPTLFPSTQHDGTLARQSGNLPGATIGSIFPPQQHAGTLARQPSNTLASLGLAPAATDATGPMTYEQALAMAQKMMGEAGAGSGSEMAPIDAAIKAAQNTAANSSKQAKANSARTQSDLAVLYGRLGNYVKGLLTGEQAANKTAQSQVGGSYDHLMTTDAANAAHGQAGVAGELARLGLGDQASNANMNAAQDAQHIAAMLSANKTSTLGNMKANATGAENVLRDMRAGAGTYGTGLVGQAKVAGQNELANIATALQNEIGSLNSQKAGIRSSSGKDALNLAMQILSKQGTGGLNDLQKAQEAKIIAETQALQNKTANPTDPYKGTANQGLNAASQYLQGAASSPSVLPTLAMILGTAENGNRAGKNPYEFNANNLPTINAAVQQSVKNHNLSPADAAALMNAVAIALKVY